jgi:hypothetical protein
MAKALIVGFEGHELAFSPRRVDRAQLYGTRRRVAIDAEGRVCAKASLTQDGTTLLLPGMTAQGHFAPDGRWVSRSEMVGLDAAGQPVPVQPSTLGVAQVLTGPVDPRDVLTVAVESVFALTPHTSDSPLEQALRSGAIYSCPFNYTAGLGSGTAYLVGNAEGCFALVGSRLDAPWTEEGAAFVPDVTADDADADLDFEQL